MDEGHVISSSAGMVAAHTASDGSIVLTIQKDGVWGSRTRVVRPGSADFIQACRIVEFLRQIVESDADLPAFEVMTPQGAFKVWADGRIEGFGTQAIVTNRIWSLMAKARREGRQRVEDPRKGDDHPAFTGA